jgi:23S rRNA pseudouridine1911/1915/1917 synthase
MEIEVLFEDNETLIINKPVGLVVNRAESVSGFTVQDWVEDYLRIKYQVSSIKYGEADIKLFLDRSGICHRLDKETSGCLVIAKNPEALRYYLKLFKDRKLTKEYVALVHGRVEPSEGTVVLPLKRSQFDREKWQVHYEGKRAVTEWKVLERYKYENSEHWKNALTYLRLNLKTGRTHQIRVHLSFLGWPIFADDKYLNKELALRDREKLTHHFLHAERMTLETFAGEKLEVMASLPDDCNVLLKSLTVD